jgi:hypothetical protein
MGLAPQTFYSPTEVWIVSSFVPKCLFYSRLIHRNSCKLTIHSPVHEYPPPYLAWSEPRKAESLWVSMCLYLEFQYNICRAFRHWGKLKWRPRYFGRGQEKKAMDYLSIFPALEMCFLFICHWKDTTHGVSKETHAFIMIEVFERWESWHAGEDLSSTQRRKKRMGAVVTEQDAYTIDCFSNACSVATTFLKQLARIGRAQKAHAEPQSPNCDKRRKGETWCPKSDAPLILWFQSMARKTVHTHTL